MTARANLHPCHPSPATRRLALVLTAACVLASIAPASAGLALAAGQAGTWSTVPGDPPAGRTQHSAIYDAVGDRMVISCGRPASDTWSLLFSGAAAGWRHHPAGGPSPRYGQSAICDPIRRRMILFGGVDSVSGQPLNDLWAFSFAAPEGWTQLLPPGTAPAGRHGHAAIYDPVRDRMIVLGGRVGSYRGGGGTSTDEVWALTLGANPGWTRLNPSGLSPLLRERTSMVYDSHRDRIVFYGGRDMPPGLYLGDLWALSLGVSPEWSLINAAGVGPGPREDASAVYDAPRDRLVLFGGDRGALLNDTWELPLDGVNPTWSEIVTATRPSARNGSSAVLDPLRQRMIVFGGLAGAVLNDVWTLSLDGPPAWSNVSPASMAPSPRALLSAIYDAAGQRLVAFGGYGPAFFNDCWALALGAVPTWSAMPTQGVPPSARIGATAIYDPARREMVVFGGYTGSWQNDVSILVLSSATWSHPAAGGFPPVGRYEHSAIYDGSRDRMVIFGGYRAYDPSHPNAPAFVNDTYEFSLATRAWNPIYIGPTTPPSGRIDASAIYDPVRDRMLVFGGIDNGGLYPSEVSALRFGNSAPWEQLVPLGAPPPGRRGAQAIYDPIRDRMIVFGGANAAGELDDTWELSLSGTPVWTQLDPGGAIPRQRWLGVSVYDSGYDRMAIFGGFDAAGFINDGGLLAWQSPTAVSISLEGVEASAGRIRLTWWVGANVVLGVERRTESSAWEPVGSGASGSSGSWTFEDMQAEPGVRYGYRLEVMTGEGAAFGGEVWAERLASVVRLAIASVRPMPVLGEARVELDLPAARDTRIDVLDASGRRVASRALPAQSPGAHVVRLNELGAQRAGVYFLRLWQAGRSVTRRVVVLH